MRTQTRFTRFEPGDGTQYRMVLCRIPGRTFNYGLAGGYLVSIENMGLCHAFGQGDYFTLDELLAMYPHHNPWTVRALAQFIRECGVETLGPPIPDVKAWRGQRDNDFDEALANADEPSGEKTGGPADDYDDEFEEN